MAPRTQLAPYRDPFTLMRQMASEFDRLFESFPAAPIGWPALRARSTAEAPTWFPEIDVMERDNQLITRVDLPGVKKEDVKVEVTDGYLSISGERKTEAEEKKEHFYRCERQYGSFHRTVPLPEGVKPEDIKATFADGVLEVSVPLPAKAEAKARRIEIQDAQAKAAV